MENNATKNIVRSKRRTLALEITGDGRLLVRAPMRMPLGLITDFVEEHRDWIEKKQASAKQRPPVEPRQFADGETFLFLGRPRTLEIVKSAARPVVLDGTLKMAEEILPHARRALTDWYRRQAEEIIGGRAAVYEQATGLRHRRIRINGAVRRWGSCSAAGSLNFSWRLVMAPPAVIDYVVVHELVHLEIQNHSRRFWARVGAVVPDYKNHRRWLRDSGRLLAF